MTLLHCGVESLLLLVAEVYVMVEDMAGYGDTDPIVVGVCGTIDQELCIMNHSTGRPCCGAAYVKWYQKGCILVQIFDVEGGAM